MERPFGVTVERLSQRHPTVGMKTLCRLFGNTRQAWYKAQKSGENKEFAENILLDEVRKVRVALPRCGTEKLHFLLQEKGAYEQWNIKIGRGKLADLLRRNGMLIKRKKRGRKTTNSSHPYRKYANTAKNIEITGPNQVWVADITTLSFTRFSC